MQQLPQTPIDGILDVTESNQAQQRGPHGLFRYFGKLAPDVTAALLSEAVQLIKDSETILVNDPMCGCGTTLVEAAERGWRAFGTDVNPVAVLYARVKTRSLNRDYATTCLEEIATDSLQPNTEQIHEVFMSTVRADRWFSETARREIARVRLLLDRIPEGRERDALLASLLSRLRAYSNASVRTGRIFFDPSSAVADIRSDFLSTAANVLKMTPSADLDCVVELADARHIPTNAGGADIVFCHPPYFGLYRFSADVLRFELEVGGWDRKVVAKREIAEGWKSGDVRLLDKHVEDMRQVMAEVHRVIRPDGVFVLVTSNSTLGDTQLPVIDRLVSAAESESFNLLRHLERTARFVSASYHKSARADKVITRDHALFFRVT